MTRDDETREAAWQVAIRDNKVRYEPGFLVKALREAFTEGARWADRTMIERACQWLQTAIYLDYENSIEHRYESMEEFINHFKKAMQDESTPACPALVWD